MFLPSLFSLLALASPIFAHTGSLTLHAKRSETCETPQGPGACISTSACSSKGGKSVPDHCGGGNDIQCCVEPKCSTPKGDGTCRATWSCGGTKVSDYCPGGDDIQCCISTSGLGDNKCSTPQGGGNCVSTSVCDGKSVPGYCPGGNDNQCCVPNSGMGDNKCSTPQGAGHCLSTSACNAKSIPGFCPGVADIQCCVANSGIGDALTNDACHTPRGDGTCKSTSSCKATSIPGYCGGGDDNQCCVETSGIGENPGGSDAPPPQTSSDPHPVNEKSINLLKELEGFREHSYIIGGDKTIGYGHDCTQRGDCAKIPDPMTREYGEGLFRRDLVGYEDCVCSQANAKKLTANQYGAFVSFTYNSGCGGLERSFKSYFSSGDFGGACDALPDKITNDGLLTGRRRKERDLCNTATSATSGC